MNKDKEEFLNTLIEKRQIPLYGEISEDSFGILQRSLNYLNAKGNEEIKLLINSAGGDVKPGLCMYDAVRLSNAPVVGEVCGIANSMSAIVLQGCSKRIATRNSWLTIHEIKKNSTEVPVLSTGGILFLDVEKIKEKFRGSVELSEIIFQIIHSRTYNKTSLNEIFEIFRSGKTMSAQEALKLGLIDEII
jgi:ATP-dependent protease ClpP protease subunit